MCVQVSIGGYILLRFGVRAFKLELVVGDVCDVW